MKIIAESACNHNGSVDVLRQLVSACKYSGADYFTCQVMILDEFCEQSYDRYKLYEDIIISKNDWRSIFGMCQREGIQVIPCVLDIESFRFCYDYGFRMVKVHGSDINNIPLLTAISQVDCGVLLETQCATYVEISIAVNLIKNNLIALFTGFSNYPTEIKDLHLNAIETLKEFGVATGYADHSRDPNVALMVMARGYDYLELHVTNDRATRNYDWQVSYTPSELKIIVEQVKYYGNSFGLRCKHPCYYEKMYRNGMYKKVLESGYKRSNKGKFYIEHLLNKFSGNAVSIIARNNSSRLPHKVLLPFKNTTVIQYLYDSMASHFNRVYVATSRLPSDDDLVSDKINVFRGSAESVVDRMLMLALHLQVSTIFRVTGDNPFTCPIIMKRMLYLMNRHNLDYIRVLGLPFGVSAELYSVKYLWRLYLSLTDTYSSEYLTWFVLKDETVKRGVIHAESEFKDIELVNLSIDYKEDYVQCCDIANKLSTGYTLSELLTVSNEYPRVDPYKQIKLPGERVLLSAYLAEHRSSTVEYAETYQV